MKILYTYKSVLDLPKELFVKDVGWPELQHEDHADCSLYPHLNFGAYYQNGKSKIPKKIESKIMQNIEDSVYTER